MLGVLLALALAGTSSAPSPASAAVTSDRLAPDLSRSLDAIMLREMNERRIAGASIAVVRNGQMLYAQGFGFADVEAGAPVTSETPFLTASVGKMFTATAIMLLVHEGLIDLDAPVGRYWA